MNWIAGLYALLKAIPDIVALGKTIIGIIHEAQDYEIRKQKLQALNTALKTAKTTGDTSLIEGLFNGLSPVSSPQPGGVSVKPTNP